MHAWNQFSLTCAVNKGKYSHHFLYPMLLIEFCMLCCCAWVKLDLKLQICAKGGLSLFRILLEPDQGLIRNICPNEALLWVPARKFYFQFGDVFSSQIDNFQTTFADDRKLENVILEEEYRARFKYSCSKFTGLFFDQSFL